MENRGRRRNTDSVQNTEGHGQTQTGDEGLIPRHGGFRHLKTFQLSELIYDVTVLFCDRYIDLRSRTHDQMVQGARSGRQNIAEGSVDSATSQKMEMKLTGVARGSLEELRLDYEDFLRQRGLPQWPRDHPALLRFRERRCATLEDFRAWVAEERRTARQQGINAPQNTDRVQNTDRHGQTRTGGQTAASAQAAQRSTPDVHGVRVSPCPSVFRCPSVSSDASSSWAVSPTSPVTTPPSSAVLAANGALSLLNLCLYLLDRQLQAQAAAFEKNGGFTERLYRRRSQRRQTQTPSETP